MTIVQVIAALGLVLAARLLLGSRSKEETVRAAIVRQAVKHPWLTVGAMAGVAVFLAIVLVLSGVVPIGASSGHWRITAALLDFAKVRSVSTHSWGIHAPPLEDQALVLRGAGHYESACLSCHGAPGRGASPVTNATTPHPPPLPGRLERWTAEQLFTIVKHGIKFTGMPAWPMQQRDDEVWAMVAFLRRMPALDGSGYRALAYGETASGDESAGLNSDSANQPPQEVRQICARCHTLDGTGRGPGAFPSLAGQRADYLYASLRAFADGSRFSGTMRAIATNLSDDAMRRTAAYYAARPSRRGETEAESSAVERGARIASHGIPTRDIPACAECHGPDERPKNPGYPRLAGQHARYLAEQLRLLQEGRRGGTTHVTLMQVFVKRLRPDEIRDVTTYFGSTRE
jgi:cytochrome c553